MNLYQWALKHSVSMTAIHELHTMLGLSGTDPTATEAGTSEAGVQSAVRLEAAQKGLRLFRNNVGVLPDATGRPVRYGLGNDSSQLNKTIKSADLIGIRPITITSAHVGLVIGQFVSREIKAAGWRYTGADREPAQLAWAELVMLFGGDAAFATGTGSL